MMMTPIVVVVDDATLAGLAASVAATEKAAAGNILHVPNGWTLEMLVAGLLLKAALGLAPA